MLSLDKVFDAQTVLKSIIRETNVVKTYGIAPDCDLYLKPENLQITGSFKVRGSAYKISQLSAEEKAKGVIACSAGNHAPVSYTHLDVYKRQVILVRVPASVYGFVEELLGS